MLSYTGTSLSKWTQFTSCFAHAHLSRVVQTASLVKKFRFRGPLPSVLLELTGVAEHHTPHVRQAGRSVYMWLPKNRRRAVGQFHSRYSGHRLQSTGSCRQSTMSKQIDHTTISLGLEVDHSIDNRLEPAHDTAKGWCGVSRTR